MSELIEELRSLNRKERFILLREAAATVPGQAGGIMVSTEGTSAVRTSPGSVSS